MAHEKKQRKLTAEKKLVLKVLPEEFILTTSLYFEQFQTKTTVIRWRLPKKIDPFNINADLEILSDNLQRLSKQYKLEGHQVTTVIANRISPLKVISIPLNLNTAADKKEYAAMQKQAYEFWKEYDEGLVDTKDAQIRANFLALNDNDGTSTMLYTACSSKIIKEYTAMILGGNLYPIGFIPEDQSIIRIVESRLTRIERERPFCIFFLTQGDSRLIYVNSDVFYIAKVNISDMDEILFDELPEAKDSLAINSASALDDDTDNLFWSEVTNRLTASLKQAFAFLKDELKASKVETVFFISDHAKENILFELFRKNFRLANFRSLSSQFTFEMLHNPDVIEADEVMGEKNLSEYKNYGSFMLPNLGCYHMQYFSSPSYKNMVIETPLFNLHPKYRFIVNNFTFYDRYQIGKKLMFTFLVLSCLTLGFVSLNKKNDMMLNALNEFTNMSKDLEQEKNLLGAESATKAQIMTDLAKLQNLDKGNYNEKLFKFFNADLPTDLELERVVVRRNSFILLGNGKSFSEVNRFYEHFSANPNFKDLIFKVFKRKDSNLQYFEIKGNTISPNTQAKPS